MFRKYNILLIIIGIPNIFIDIIMKDNFKVVRIDTIGTWKRALNMARMTVGKKPIEKDPSSEWKKSILLAEHSPIREVVYDVFWEGIKQRITVHYVRHHQGIEKFVSTQRDDRNKTVTCSDDLPQGALNNMAFSANAQAFINISKVRLCKQASPDTRYAWIKTLEALNEIDPELVSKCVPSCIYRGRCPETSKCGYDKTEDFRNKIERYWNG